ncbi:MurR/RpiR family transcriptional regulator [Nigerium massiliense]|uniref:MurR/RpiR family transcriptional regulator n=1 Tax=Nigerium massiliense TaxID=1522317 RepID=UPI000590F8A2|nr:MurR/RpiR family transcriptional regulator [Nigerium massiliense]
MGPKDAVSSPDVLSRIGALLEQLPASQRAVCRVLQEDPGQAAGLTVTELAERAGTSTATVIRTVRELGFQGYASLRLALAVQGASGERAAQVADIAEEDSLGTVLAKLARFESEQMHATAELVDQQALEAVVDAVTGARRIDVYGIGASGLVAHDLESKLLRIGLNARALTERDSALASASLLTAEDVAIGFSHAGENPGTCEPLALARRLGAATVGVTGRTRSAITSVATHVIATAGREFGLRSAAIASRAGQLLIVDALFVGVASRVPDAAEALRRTYAAVAKANAPGGDPG